jgi:DNA-binding CsgD family transcriptional regulator
MTPAEICSSVHVLRAQGHTLREISRLLHLARNTVTTDATSALGSMPGSWTNG